MSNTVIKVENLSKQYRLGQVSTGTLAHDVNRWWHKLRGKEDPYLKIGETNDRTQKGNSEYVWALRDINFEVTHGEVLGIIGRNGAGKSTLLKILSRTTAPSTGSIKIKGRVASLLEVGTGFHPELSGRDNIFLNGAILGMTKREIARKFDEIVDFAGVERYIDTPVKRYSSGMYVRLAFAVAAHLEPEILIVDEVLAVGDAEFQKKALGKMQNVSESEGRTVLFVSHNMAAVKNLCQKGIVMSNGTLSYEGLIDEAVTQYLKSDLQEDISLEYRKDRYGNKRFVFTGISILNAENKVIESVMTGDYLKIKILYDCDEDIDINRIILGINLRDEFENDILSFISDEMKCEFRINNEKAIYLEIPSLLLRGSMYSIRLFASYVNTNAENICDSIENAAILKVDSSDFWSSGKSIRSKKEAIIKGIFFS